MPDILTKKVQINEKLSILSYLDAIKNDNFKADVEEGLTAKQKYLLPKYFYDERGSTLFDEICKLDEYYVARTETEILEKQSDEIIQANLNHKLLVELGSGSCEKTRYLLDAFFRKKEVLHYIPIDISDVLVSSCQKLIQEYNNLKITGIISDYHASLDLLPTIDSNSKLIVFLGTSIGNYTKVDALHLLTEIRKSMNPEDSLLIGFDMIKDEEVLTSAYNDAKGVTAMFNINVLTRINNELGGNFDISKFKHTSIFNPKENRIEMHLISLVNQGVEIKSIDKKFQFQKGESIHTENSYKFNDEIINNMSNAANLKVVNSWKDSLKYFSLCLLRPL